MLANIKIGMEMTVRNTKNVNQQKIRQKVLASVINLSKNSEKQRESEIEQAGLRTITANAPHWICK